MTATLTREQQDALSTARQLAAAGIPIFTASPDPHASTGYRLPSRWQHTIPNSAAVDSWHPGMALCAVMGHGLDVIDIDPRSGGNPAALGGTMPISYGCATTPSGGRHSFIKSLGVRSRDKVVTGIDIKAGDSTGEGRGFVFLPPTERASKVDGVKRVYQWLTPPDLHRLNTEGLQDNSGNALVRLINMKRNGRHPASSGVPTPGEFMQGRPWDDIEKTLAEGRNNGTHKLASALRGKGGYTLEGAMEIMYERVWPHIEAAPGDHPFTRAEFEAAIHSAWRYPDGTERRAMENTGDAEFAKTLPPAGNLPLSGHSGVVVETQRSWDAYFWESRDMLTHIRDFALSRRCSPWATLGVVLVRVIAATPHNVVLPPLIGGIASLNLFLAVVGPSGSGKGGAVSTARDAIQIMAPFAEHSIGSGQGIAHAYKHWVSGCLVPRATSAIFHVEEIDHFVGLTNQSSSTLLPELRRLWMGERLGNLYVDPKRRIEIESHTYRAGLIAGVQPGRAGVLLNDVEAGTPQRFIWLPATYPHPDQRPAAPPCRSWRPPPWVKDPPPPQPPQDPESIRTGPPPPIPPPPRVTLEIPPCAQKEIDAAALARGRGQVDTLDGHRLLCQLKVAAAFGVLDQRTAVNEEDWQLAGRVLAYSDVIRKYVTDYLAYQSSVHNTARGRLEATRAVMVDDARENAIIERVALSVARHLDRASGGWLARKELREKINQRDRQYLDNALERLTDRAQVEMRTTDRGAPQYRRIGNGGGGR